MEDRVTRYYYKYSTIGIILEEIAESNQAADEFSHESDDSEVPWYDESEEAIAERYKKESKILQKYRDYSIEEIVVELHSAKKELKKLKNKKENKKENKK